MREDPPRTGIERPAPKTRATRTFSNDEIRAIFASVNGSQLEDLVPLIFHTATRSEETRSMRWSHVDLERAVWHLPATQTEAGQDLPLSRGAMAILQRIREGQQRDAKVVPIASADFVFPAPTGKCDTCGLAGHMDKPNKSTGFNALWVVQGVPRPERAKVAYRGASATETSLCHEGDSGMGLVTSAVAFLASEGSGCVTGIELFLDGGLDQV